MLTYLQSSYIYICVTFIYFSVLPHIDFLKIEENNKVVTYHTASLLYIVVEKTTLREASSYYIE